MARDYPLLIGACGWSHSSWVADFYPEDLPSDWRLSYYANEFPVVLVTAEEWRLPEADATKWCEESEASFCFVLEISANTVEEAQSQLPRAAAFADRCVGSLLRASVNIDVKTLEDLLDRVIAFSPVCVDFGNEVPAASVIQVLQSRQISWCWHGEGESEGLMLGPFAVTRISSNDVNPRQIRHWVETCLTAGDERRQMILLFDGEPPDIEAIRQAQIICDLL
ncbi:MAG: DUF72 domain-containing protein [Gammaproteobacteria bacterium]|nr:DUF72 domain-containing protein [Gammaproteobacteria bacterium]